MTCAAVALTTALGWSGPIGSNARAMAAESQSKLTQPVKVNLWRVSSERPKSSPWRSGCGARSTYPRRQAVKTAAAAGGIHITSVFLPSNASSLLVTLPYS